MTALAHLSQPSFMSTFPAIDAPVPIPAKPTPTASNRW